MWQMLHPDNYVEPMTAEFATYTIAVNSKQDADSRKELVTNRSGLASS